MNRCQQIFYRSFLGNGQRTFHDQFGGVWSAHVQAKELSCCFVRDDLYESGRISDNQRFSVADQWEDADLIVESFLNGFFFGESDAG